MAKVNLDALIPREDFEVEDNSSPGKKKETISIEDIKADSFFFLNVRKPDFQRETNEWDSKKICELIKSFIEGDLIPAIILWRSTSGYLFLIDGSHRLSSLSAWVNDDYGDGNISKGFYDGIIPDEQRAIADKTITETIEIIKDNSVFNYLKIDTINQNISTSRKNFNTNNKSEIFIKDTLPNAPRCKICNGFIHKNSISIDHKQRRQDGGLANIDNGQLTHPYCNTGYKN